MSDGERTTGRRIGLWTGFGLFALVLLLPTPAALTPAAQRALAMALLMATWWMTEALPTAATALVPLVLIPALGIGTTTAAAEPYANPNVFLFLGGFMLAQAMQRWGLHRRLALMIIRTFGGSPRRLLLSFMAATACLSMWVSNTATTVMMLPIAVGVVDRLTPQNGPGGAGSPDPAARTACALMLGIAYAASVGGIATLIGTPPNVIFAGQVHELLGSEYDVGFVRWMGFALPIAIGFLVIIFLYLAFVVGRLSGRADPGSDAKIREEHAALGRWSRGEIMVLVIFALTALAWLTRGDLRIEGAVIRGWAGRFGIENVDDSSVAVAAALLLLMIPVRVTTPTGETRHTPLLDWASALKLPWGVLLVFGGGFSLARSFQSTGLDVWLGQGIETLHGLPGPLLVLVLCLGVTFLTEVTSNAATATMLMPVLASAAVGLDVHPFLLMIPATISASFAFMLPAATPPNAIVFGSGRVTIRQMARTGLVLNILGAVWLSLLSWALIRPLVVP